MHVICEWRSTVFLFPARVEWINMAQDWYKWQAVVNTVRKGGELSIPAEQLLTSYELSSMQLTTFKALFTSMAIIFVVSVIVT